MARIENPTLKKIGALVGSVIIVIGGVRYLLSQDIGESTLQRYINSDPPPTAEQESTRTPAWLEGGQEEPLTCVLINSGDTVYGKLRNAGALEEQINDHPVELRDGRGNVIFEGRPGGSTPLDQVFPGQELCFDPDKYGENLD